MHIVKKKKKSGETIVINSLFYCWFTKI